MSSSCVHDCRHPLWGGTGTCHNGVGDTSAICECDPGYATRDAWGNASCVPRVVLVSAYVFLASVSVLAGALMLWDINTHRRLPARYQISRKRVIRTRALLSSRYERRSLSILEESNCNLRHSHCTIRGRRYQCLAVESRKSICLGNIGDLQLKANTENRTTIFSTVGKYSIRDRVLALFGHDNMGMILVFPNRTRCKFGQRDEVSIFHFTTAHRFGKCPTRRRLFLRPQSLQTEATNSECTFPLCNGVLLPEPALSPLSHTLTTISPAGWPSLSPRSVYMFGFAILGVVMALRAGETGYADLGIWQTQYLFFTPSLMFGIAMMAEYWVQSLPSQVRSRGRRRSALFNAPRVHSNKVLFSWTSYRAITF